MSSAASGAKPTVAMLVPQTRQSEVFTPTTLDRLSSFARVIALGEDTAALARRLPEVLPEVDACLTGWGSPPFTLELLERAPKLKIIAHSAGSIKRLIPIEAFARGIVVSHAADIIAEAVSEFTLLLMLTGLRRSHLMDSALKAGHSWREARDIFAGHQLAGSDVRDEEPLPADSPFRQLDNVFITPHQAGHSVETHLKQGAAMVDELERFFSGRPVRYQIGQSAYATMA